MSEKCSLKKTHVLRKSSEQDKMATQYDLYGSDSAKNFRCSKGLALTLSSFTTA